MNYPTTLLTILLLTLYSVGLADPIETDQTLAPYFQIISGSDVETSEVEVFPLLATEVDVKISGIIANVEVRQTYQNRGKSPLEAIYVFPGSTRAAVHGLALKIEDRTIEADVQERQQANATYEQAKNEGKTASLLEQHRPNVFQMNVANILSGETVEAVLQYTERLKPTDKIYDFAFPTVVGPRYSGGATLSSRPQDQWVANPYLEPDGDVEAVDLDPHRFHIDVHLDAGMPIQELICDTHLAETNYLSPSQVEVKMSDPGVGAGNRDFILRYRLADETIASGLLLHEGDEDEENFFLLTVQPPERVHPEPNGYLDYVGPDLSAKASVIQANAADLAALDEVLQQIKPSYPMLQ
ncbi:MAG: VIT domain-containing protein, partial [Verrucomicrobiota bacterium]